MTEPFFFDGEEEDEAPPRSALAELTFGIGGALAVFAALFVIAVVIYLGVTMIDFGQWLNWGEHG